MEEQYFWTAYAVKPNGDDRECDTNGNNLREDSVTESCNAEIFDFLLIPQAKRKRFEVRRDFDGRAYLYRNGADDYCYCVESERMCAGCEVAEGACDCDSQE